MLTSARNKLKAKVSSVAIGAVQAEIGLMLGDNIICDVIVTNNSAERLKLKPGSEVLMLFKASSIILVDPLPGLQLSARNQIAGTVVSVTEGAGNSEIELEVDKGLTLVAIVTKHSAEALGLVPGKSVLCCIKASSIILAIESGA